MALKISRILILTLSLTVTLTLRINRTLNLILTPSLKISLTMANNPRPPLKNALSLELTRTSALLVNPGSPCTARGGYENFDFTASPGDKHAKQTNMHAYA